MTNDEIEVATEPTTTQPNQRKAEKIPKTHVDVIKVYNVVHRKLEHSGLAYSFLLYLVWMSFYFAAAIMQRDAAPSQSLQQVMSDYMAGAYRDPVTLELKSFLDIKDVKDFWDWHIINFIPLVLGSTWDRPNTLLLQSRLTNGFEMMQRRSVKRPCKFADSRFNNFAQYCYGTTLAEGLVGDVDKSNFLGSDNVTVFSYEEVDVGYGLIDPGYFQRFEDMSDVNKLTSQIQSLRNNQWVNGGTRYVRTDFVTYNPSVGIFVLVMLKVQFTNNGNVIPDYQSATLPATFYYTWTDHVRMVLEIITVIFWAIKSFSALQNGLCGWSRKMDFDVPVPQWKLPLAIMSNIQLVFFLVIFGIWAKIVNDPYLSGLTVTGDTVTVKGNMLNFNGAALVFQIYWVIHGVNILLTVLLILCYFNMNSGMSQLSTTLRIMASNLFQFGIVFFLLMSAFMLMAHILFGSLLLQYSYLQNSFLSIFQILLGSGDYFALEDVDSIGAPLFYYPFLFIMVFVVFNVTIAIIMDGYVAMQELRKEMKDGDYKDVVELPIWTQVGHGLMRLLFPLQHLFPESWKRITIDDHTNIDRFDGASKREILFILEEFVGDNDRAVPFEELKKKVSDRNITEEALSAIFDRYQGWVKPPDAETEEIQYDANASMIEKADSFKQALQEVIKDQDELNKKVDFILQNWNLAMGK